MYSGYISTASLKPMSIKTWSLQALQNPLDQLKLLKRLKPVKPILQLNILLIKFVCIHLHMSIHFCLFLLHQHLYIGWTAYMHHDIIARVVVLLEGESPFHSQIICKFLKVF